MAGLLVSVRSAEEAEAAARGGAAVIDVKDPFRGPMGMADPRIWSEVRSSVPARIAVSIALGELSQWDHARGPDAASIYGIDVDALSQFAAGIAFRKVGLAGSASDADWPARWAALRARWQGPPWVAVVYVDFEQADAPGPDPILDAALAVPDCVGVLLDTWDKSNRATVDESWLPVVSRAKAAGRLVAVAGRLNSQSIRRLAPLGPDLFGVRSAACVDGDRLGAIDPVRVANLAAAAASLDPRIWPGPKRQKIHNGDGHVR